MFSFYFYVGLINEIMSKGRRMTYEELCNAVLPVRFLLMCSFIYLFVLTFIYICFPICFFEDSFFLFGCNCLFCYLSFQHWHNLRKHNGERYAYSSHSQAVLDCLRNRHEWARLVDRGPKVCL